MKIIKVLNNQNKLYNEITSNASYENQCEEFSFRVVFTGNERFNIGGKNLSIYPGSFLVINGGTVFSREIYSDIPANTFSILYNPKFLNEFHNDNVCSDDILLDDPFSQKNRSTPIFLETIYPFNGDMMFNLVHLKNHFDTELHNDMLINEYMYYSLINFYRLYKKEILVKSDQLNVLNNKTRVELFRRLNNAKDYMMSNYNQILSVQEICRYACLSEMHFYRTFKQTYGCSPHQYLVKLRLTSARHMLKNTNYGITEIVSLSGFDNASSFIRLFKDRFGVTPGNFRKGIAA